MMIKWDNVALVISMLVMIFIVVLIVAVNHKVVELTGGPLTTREILAIVIFPSFLWVRIEYSNYKNNKKDK